MNPTLTTLEQHDGEKLKIAPASIVFIEQMTNENKKRFEGAVSGIFYDDEEISPTGERILTSVMLRVPFQRVVKLASLGRPAAFLRLDRADEVQVALLASTVVSYRGLSKDMPGRPENAVTVIRHRLGSRVFSVFVTQTFDEVEAMMEEAQTAGAPPGLIEVPLAAGAGDSDEEEQNDGSQSEHQGDQSRGSGRRAEGGGGVRAGAGRGGPRQPRREVQTTD